MRRYSSARPASALIARLPATARATVRSASRSTLAYTEVVARSRCRSTWLISTRSLPWRSISLASA